MPDQPPHHFLQYPQCRGEHARSGNGNFRSVLRDRDVFLVRRVDKGVSDTWVVANLSGPVPHDRRPPTEWERIIEGLVQFTTRVRARRAAYRSHGAPTAQRRVARNERDRLKREGRTLRGCGERAVALDQRITADVGQHPERYDDEYQQFADTHWLRALYEEWYRFFEFLLKEKSGEGWLSSSRRRALPEWMRDAVDVHLLGEDGHPKRGPRALAATIEDIIHAHTRIPTLTVHRRRRRRHHVVWVNGQVTWVKQRSASKRRVVATV